MTRAETPPFKTLADDLAFPEGPIAMADGSVLVVEIAAGRLSRVSAEGKVETVADIGGGPNGAAMGPDGYCYVCNNGGFRWHRDEQGLRPHGPADDYAGGRIERVDLRTGKVERLYDRAQTGPLRAPNDLIFDSHGGFWFTDTGVGRPRELDRGAVFYARADGSGIEEVVFPMIQPNGVGLSPDGDVLYVAETVTGRLWAFELEGPGRLRRQAWPSPHGGRLLFSTQGYRPLDSLAMDKAGNIVVATLYDGGVIVVSPSGELIQDVRLPDRIVTNVCFGGAELATAFVTMSHTGKLIALDLGRSGAALRHSA